MMIGQTARMLPHQRAAPLPGHERLGSRMGVSYFNKQNHAVMRIWASRPGHPLAHAFCPYNQAPSEDHVIPTLFENSPQPQLRNGMVVEIEGKLYLAASYYMRTSHDHIFDALARHLSQTPDPKLIPTPETRGRIHEIWAGEMRLVFGAQRLSIQEINETSSFWQRRNPYTPAGVPIRNLAQILKASQLAPWFNFDSPQMHAFDPDNQKLSARLEELRRQKSAGSHGIRSKVVTKSQNVISELDTQYDQDRLIASIRRLIDHIDYFTTLINIWVDDGWISVDDWSKFEGILIRYVLGHRLEQSAFLFFTEFIDRISEMLDTTLTPHLVDVFAIES